MSRVEVERTVAAPPDRCFAVATDLGRMAETMSGVDHVETLTTGPFGEGTRWRETRTIFGRQAVEEMWVTGFDPPRSFVVEAESHGAHYRTEILFAAEGEGTRMTLVFGARPLTLFARVFSLLGAVMTRSVRKMLEQDLEDLRRAAEASA